MVSLVSCGNKDSGSEAVYDPSKPVQLTSFYPDSGRIAEKVMLKGSNFGSDPDKIKVYFNQKRAAVIASIGSQMYVICPRLPGELCDISVVVGNDSVVYPQQFRYKVSVSVSTITGNGTSAFKAGTLSEATMKARYLAIDKDNNILVTLSDVTPYGFAKISEAENSVIALLSTNDRNACDPTVISLDVATGIFFSSHDSAIPTFFTLDPKEGYGVRTRNWTWKEGTTDIPVWPYKKGMAYCSEDGRTYIRMYTGHLVKINPKNYEAEVVCVLPQADCYGLAFHPKKPNLLYMSLAYNAGAQANGIYVIDVTDPNPADTYQRLNSPSTIPGFRDGDLATAQFNSMIQIQFDRDGNLYICDSDNHCIRRITADDKVETVVGIPGVGGWKDGGKEDALFKQPMGVTVSEDGIVYIADTGNCRIRKLAIE
jgi:hypothetical protein